MSAQNKILTFFNLKIVNELLAYSDSIFSCQSYVVAIIVPDQEVLEPWAQSKKIPGDFAQLCENEVGMSSL